MATNTTGMTAGFALREEALRLQRLESAPQGAAERALLESVPLAGPHGNGGTPTVRESGPEQPRLNAAAAAEDAQSFALLPLVDKIAYAFASGLIVAMRELEAHIAGETQKVSENVNRRLDSLQASFHELTGALSEQRSLSVAVQEKCVQLEAVTVALAQTDERQEADLNALRSDAATLTASVAERFDHTAASLQEADARQTAEIAALREQDRESAASLSNRIGVTASTLEEADARNAAEVASLRAEVKELSTSAFERVDALVKELMLHQEDLAAVKNTLTGFSTTVDGFVERLDRQAEALRSMFAAYSQRETQLEQLVDGLTRLRTFPAPASTQL